MKTYKQLVAGDVRQKGDQVKRRPNCGDGVDGRGHVNELGNTYLATNPNMIGQLILPADLVAHEYFRPQ